MRDTVKKPRDRERRRRLLRRIGGIAVIQVLDRLIIIYLLELRLKRHQSFTTDNDMSSQIISFQAREEQEFFAMP